MQRFPKVVVSSLAETQNMNFWAIGDQLDTRPTITFLSVSGFHHVSGSQRSKWPFHKNLCGWTHSRKKYFRWPPPCRHFFCQFFKLAKCCYLVFFCVNLLITVWCERRQGCMEFLGRKLAGIALAWRQKELQTLLGCLWTQWRAFLQTKCQVMGKRSVDPSCEKIFLHLPVRSTQCIELLHIGRSGLFMFVLMPCLEAISLLWAASGTLKAKVMVCMLKCLIRRINTICSGEVPCSAHVCRVR